MLLLRDADIGQDDVAQQRRHNDLADVSEIEELADLTAVTVSDREARMATMLVKTLTAEFEPEKYASSTGSRCS